MLPPATPAAASPAPAESFGARCAKAACLKNLIVMSALQPLADCIDAEIAAFKREKAALVVPPKVEDFGDRKKIPPTPEQVTAYSASIGYPLDGAEFCDSYAAKGWMVGRTKMKDWQSAVRNWKRNGWGHQLPGPGKATKPRKF